MVIEKIKVLFLAANPADTNRLLLDEEISAINAKIRASKFRDSLELVSAWAVKADDLLQQLNEHKPAIVHICGHGSTKGEVVLVGTDGKSKLVSKEAITLLFSTLKDNIRVVVYNTCYSQSLAQTTSEVIDCAIGMNTTIGDKAAIAFASSFYRAVGFGRSIQNAFEQGKAALQMEGIPEATSPELFHKNGVDPAQLILIEDKAKGTSSRKPPIEFAEIQFAHVKSFSIQCKYSKGRGEDRHSVLFPHDCPACNGTGWITLQGGEEDYETCGNCQGSGLDPDIMFSYKPCHICHGSGLVKIR